MPNTAGRRPPSPIARVSAHCPHHLPPPPALMPVRRYLSSLERLPASPCKAGRWWRPPPIACPYRQYMNCSVLSASLGSRTPVHHLLFFCAQPSHRPPSHRAAASLGFLFTFSSFSCSVFLLHCCIMPYRNGSADRCPRRPSHDTSPVYNIHLTLTLHCLMFTLRPVGLRRCSPQCAVGARGLLLCCRA
jgi:hypothetical protein